jgi:hypothetical protein
VDAELVEGFSTAVERFTEGLLLLPPLAVKIKD